MNLEENAKQCLLNMSEVPAKQSRKQGRPTFYVNQGSISYCSNGNSNWKLKHWKNININKLLENFPKFDLEMNDSDKGAYLINSHSRANKTETCATFLLVFEYWSGCSGSSGSDRWLDMEGLGDLGCTQLDRY